jgi:hypothetical protein
MAAVAPRVLSRLVRVIAGEIEVRAARRGQSVSLNADDFEAIAEQVAELAVFPGRVGLVDARALAAELGVARDWIYANAERLGGVRLGDGPKARLRFDVERAREALSEAVIAEHVDADHQPAPRRRGRPPRQATPGVRLIQGRARHR